MRLLFNFFLDLCLLDKEEKIPSLPCFASALWRLNCNDCISFVRMLGKEACLNNLEAFCIDNFETITPIKTGYFN